MRLRLAILLGMVLVFVAFVALPAAADQGGTPNANAEFGEHHADHAKAGDLGGEMNPGMHGGKSGWDPGHTH